MKTWLGGHSGVFPPALDGQDPIRVPPHLIHQHATGTGPDALCQSQKTLHQIEAALVRLNQGTYGTCETCGRKISLARLKANPIATECVICLPD